MTQDYPAAPKRTGATEPSGAQHGVVESFESVSEAALALGHRTYSGTIATTDRVP